MYFFIENKVKTSYLPNLLVTKKNKMYLHFEKMQNDYKSSRAAFHFAFSLSDWPVGDLT